ncbi:glucosyltransferase, partial [Ascosphaera atra]
MSTRQLGGSRPALLLSSSIAIFLSSLWRNKVNQVVPSPYLDEVFHVGQAKAYWDGHWRHWDPKITTPPGLYVWSFLDMALASCLRLKRAAGSTLEFRATNGLVLLNLFQLRLRKLLEHVRGHFTEAQGRRKICPWELNWTALNICLFPPVFFFSALYYTDLAALYLVLETYIQEKQQEQERTWSFSRDLKLVIMGLLALCFRQTNIFWVAVFLGGLRAVNLLHSLTAKCQSNDLRRILQGSYSLQQLYDPPARDASLADYFKTSLSFGVTGMVNGFAVLKALTCYLVCVVAFGLFVLWNGFVVL